MRIWIEVRYGFSCEMSEELNDAKEELDEAMSDIEMATMRLEAAKGNVDEAREKLDQLCQIDDPEEWARYQRSESDTN